MSNHNPEIQPPTPPLADSAIQPNAPDFVETPDIQPLSTEQKPLPIWLYLICGFALFMAGSSFTGLGNFGLGQLDQGPGGPAISSSTASQAAEVVDPVALGKKVYGGNCANCHQSTGQGQPGTYPPLVNSEWVLGSKERLAALLLKGIQGPLNVCGSTYSAAVMPAQESALSPDKIANLMTYLRASWGNKAGPVTTDEVNAAKTKFTSQTAPYSEAELLKIAPHGPDPTDKKP